MLHTLCTVALSATLGGGPAPFIGGQGQGYYPSPAPDQYYAAPEGSAEGFVGNVNDELHPYDSPEPWLHGYVQEIPAYGGYGAFAPYNYRHVLAQSQAAGGWGMPPVMPYSQQFWHRYQEEAAMKHYIKSVGNSEYAAELARLRARYDFEVQQRTALQPQQNPQQQDFSAQQNFPLQSGPVTSMRPPQIQPIVLQQQPQLIPQPQFHPVVHPQQMQQAPIEQPQIQPQPQLPPLPVQQPQSQLQARPQQDQQQVEAMRNQIEQQHAKLRALEMTLQEQRQQVQQQQQMQPKRVSKPRHSGIKPIFER